jgi:hypothetical protein
VALFEQDELALVDVVGVHARRLGPRIARRDREQERIVEHAVDVAFAQTYIAS